MLRAYFAVGMAYVVLCGITIAVHPTARPRVPAMPVRAPVVRVPTPPPVAPSSTVWFQNVKPFCNAVEVETHLRYNPAPRDDGGAAYTAACYALGGKIGRAEGIIDSLPASSRAYAAGVVFEVAHPVADAGDNASAGPMMRLVLAYQPDNYMALYHAGMAEWTLGDHDRALTHLEAFRRLYHQDDFFGKNADGALRAMRAK